MLWLPPKVWLQGSQSSSTGGSSSRKGQTCRICCWFAASMPCVLSTPFGVPVDPEVKRIFATSVGWTDAKRRSTSSVGSAPKRSGVSSPSPVRTVRPSPTAATAAANEASSATTRPGSTRSAIARSLAWSVLCRE